MHIFHYVYIISIDNVKIFKISNVLNVNRPATEKCLWFLTDENLPPVKNRREKISKFSDRV